MSGQSEMLRQQLLTMSIQSDAANGACRSARESAEATAKESTGGRSEQQQGHRSQTDISLVMTYNSMLVPKFDGRSQQLLW